MLIGNIGERRQVQMFDNLKKKKKQLALALLVSHELGQIFGIPLSE